MIRKKGRSLFLPVWEREQLQTLKINPMCRLGAPGRDQLAGCLAVRTSLRDSLGPEAPFRPSCSELQFMSTLAWFSESDLFTRMLTYSMHNRGALYILSRGVTQPELETSFCSSMETAYGEEETGAREAEAVSWKNSIMQH